jgi:hypothetical protein
LGLLHFISSLFFNQFTSIKLTFFLGEGIKEATKQADPRHGARPNLANKIMVIFTDGWQNKGSDPGQEAAAARAAGFRVLTVGITVRFCVVGVNLRLTCAFFGGFCSFFVP